MTPRRLDADALSVIDRQRSVVHNLVFLDLVGFPMYLAIDSPGDIAFQRLTGPIIDTAPRTWTAVGGAMVVGTVEEAGNPDSGGVDVEFIAIDPEFTLGTTLIATFPFNRDFQYWRVHYHDVDAAAGSVAGAYLAFQGKLNGRFEVNSVNPEEIGAEPGMIRVSFRALNPFALLDITRAIRTNPTSHQKWYNDDMFMDQVQRTQNRRIYVGYEAPSSEDEEEE